jgi:hypothetical protein
LKSYSIEFYRSTSTTIYRNSYSATEWSFSTRYIFPNNSHSSQSLSRLGVQNPSTQFGGSQSSQSVGFPPQGAQNFGQQQQQQQPWQGKILLCENLYPFVAVH